MHVKTSELTAKRAQLVDKLTALAGGESMTAEQVVEFDKIDTEVKSLDDQFARIKKAQAVSAASAQPVAGQDNAKAFAAAESDPYLNDAAAQAVAAKKGSLPGGSRSLVLGGMIKMAALGGGGRKAAFAESVDVYGENHPVTKALGVSSGTAGGLVVPPDYVAEIIELLRPQAVVRGSNPRVLPMPRGTMTLPGQASPATASYGPENTAISTSQQSFKQIVASFKKLTALVPVSNDMMRYADPAIDAVVRDDLVRVIALREDLAFLTGDGTQSAPMGFLGFANDWVVSQGGTAGVWSATADSTAAVNGAAGASLTGQNGGNFITSTLAYTEATVVNELTGLINKLDMANVPDNRRVWFFHPRVYNYLFGLLNSLGLYVFRDELSKGTLYGYPFKKTTQMPANIWDPTGAYKNGSFIIIAEMTEAMILDSMSLELAVSREGSYIDANGVPQNAFANDQTIIRAIAEHDFQLRHSGAVAVDQFVQWSPAIT